MSIKKTIEICVKDSERIIRQSIESIIIQIYPMEIVQLARALF